MLKSTKENNLYYKSREEIIHDIFDRREFDWREANTTDNYPILSYSDYNFIHGCTYSTLPSKREYWIYWNWCLAHGFMPYGGESKNDEEMVYLLALKQIEEEAKAAERDFYRVLDEMLDMG